MVSKERIRIAVITGSMRPGNHTSMAADVVAAELQRHGVEVIRIDPHDWDLAFPGEEGGDEETARLQQQVGSATAAILATPEYHGSYSAAIKRVIENLGFPSAIAGKPVALLGVAGGAIGAIKALEHLRSVCSHIGAIVLPGPVSVPRVGKVFDQSGQVLDPKIEERLQRLAHSLVEYINQNICPRMGLEKMVREDSAES